MADPSLLAPAAAALLGSALLALALLKAWRGWLNLKRLEFENNRLDRSPTVEARVEVARLKERIRRLEAIADGTLRSSGVPGGPRVW